MENIALNITFGIFITVIPFLFYNYKTIKTTPLQTILWGILSFLLCLIGMKISHQPISYLALSLSILLSSIFNYYCTTGSINLKKVPLTLSVLTLFFLSSLFQLIPILFYHLDPANLQLKEELYLTLFSDFILVFLLIFLYRKTLLEDFPKLKNNLYPILDTGIKYWLIGLVIMVISNLLIQIFLPQANAANEESVQEFIHASRFASLFAVGILAPIIEELTFRKSFRDIFNHQTFYILASGLIFGSLHVLLSCTSPWDLFYIIPYSSLGIAFGYMYVKTDNIYTSILMHMFHNTCLTAISLLGVILW